MTTFKNNNKTLKEMNKVMANIKKAMKLYNEAETAQINSRNTKDYDKAKEQMYFSYKLMLSEMNLLVAQADILGINCDAIGVCDYNIIKKVSVK